MMTLPAVMIRSATLTSFLAPNLSANAPPGICKAPWVRKMAVVRNPAMVKVISNCLTRVGIKGPWLV